MISKRYMWSAMMIAFLAAFGVSRVALAVDEIEPNDPVANAQKLDIGSDGTAEVIGAILNDPTTTPMHRDVDFYSFPAHAGDKLQISINSTPPFSPTLAIFGPDGVDLLALQAQKGFGVPIQDFLVTQNGTYIVGVSSYPGDFMDVNTLTSPSVVQDYSPYWGVKGAYTLQISGVTPPVATPSVQLIGIKIRPFSRDVIVLASSRRHHDFDRDDDSERDREFKALRGRFKGGIAVALLSSDTFNAMEVDQSSLKFGSTDEESLVRCKRHGLDVNRDTRPDLICYFDFAKANFQPGDTEGVVTGTMNGDGAFEGRGYLKILSGKKRDRDHHH
jgi:hypothetical protein